MAPVFASTTDALRNPDIRNSSHFDDIPNKPIDTGNRAAVHTNSPTVSSNRKSEKRKRISRLLVFCIRTSCNRTAQSHSRRHVASKRQYTRIS